MENEEKFGLLSIICKRKACCTPIVYISLFRYKSLVGTIAKKYAKKRKHDEVEYDESSSEDESSESESKTSPKPQSSKMLNTTSSTTRTLKRKSGEHQSRNNSKKSKNKGVIKPADD